MSINFSTDSTLLKSNLPSQMVLSSQPAINQDSLFIKKLDSVQKAYRVFPKNVEYSLDIYEKQEKSKSDNEVLFKASDGKSYDILFHLMQRGEYADKTFYESRQEMGFWQRLTKSFQTGINKVKFRKFTNNLYEILNSQPVEKAFKELTGFEYTSENAEKFLKGELKLKIESVTEKYIGKEMKNIPPIAPHISEYYVNKKNHTDMKNSRTELSENEIKKYDGVKNSISAEHQTKLENALKNGQLLQDSPDDETTVLESLHKILVEPRAGKLDNKQILEECIDILDNPYIITQQAEDIPEEYQKECTERLVAHEMQTYEKRLENYNKTLTNKPELQSEFKGLIPIAKKMNNKQISAPISAPKVITEEYARDSIIEPIKEDLFEFRHLGTCAASSIEFYLASQHPAQFFKMVEALTSKEQSFNKNIDVKKLNCTIGIPLNKDVSDTFRLDDFNTKYTIVDKNIANVKIAPDENAYLLAEIQTKYKDEGERSIVDIIMQSTIMNLGTGSYESIGDRFGITSYECYDFAECGLTQDKSNYVLNILTDDNLKNYIYKIIDFDKIDAPYKKEDIKNEILDALNKRGSVVAGYIWGERNNGHEITIIGYTTNINGDGFFIIQDSDDWKSEPELFEENDFLEMLHHAFI